MRGDGEISLFAVENQRRHEDGAASDTMASIWKGGAKRDVGGSTRGGAGKTILRSAAPRVELARRADSWALHKLYK